MTSSINTKKIKVLYLDDEENNLKSFKAAFRRDYDVYTALTSEKAFEILKSVKPQVVFSDQRMPVTSGVEFFNAVRQIFPEPIRILITGYTDVNDIIEAINKGHVYRYITKPWNEHEIRVAIENAYDIYSTRKDLEDKVRELEKSNHELSSFIYHTSHDLRAPVASSLGLIRVARHDIEDPVALDYMEKIEKSTEGLDNLISNIIDFYKNSRQQEYVEEFEFKDLLEEVVENIMSHQGSGDALIDLDIQQNSAFKADTFRLRVVFGHLISNAIKFKKPDQDKARVRISIDSNSDEAHIQVEDEGVGILTDHMHKVFQIFFKGNNQEGGSGIGLYIVKEALDKMEGSIALKTKPDNGTLFSIKIPNRI